MRSWMVMWWSLAACSGAPLAPDDKDPSDTTPTDTDPSEDSDPPTGDDSDRPPVDDTDADTDDTPPVDVGQVWLNEVLADNESGLEDEAGQREDWLELYNGTDTTVDLSGWVITDGFEPFEVPAGTTIAAGGYLLVWCDGDEDGPLHAPFKLSKEVDAVELLDASGDPVDRVGWDEASGGALGLQEADRSVGRSPDGSAGWEQLDPPTPGASNG
jgi:hypothetical protein